MDEKKYCLVYEPWIRVINNRAEIKEVSLKELFHCASDFRDFAGEIPMQNIAVLRFLLSIMHAVIPDYDLNGEKRKCLDPDEILDRYEEIWHNQRFPKSAFDNYLDEWEDSFWLVHPDRPFYQVPRAENELFGTQCSAAKLNGELFESNNQVQLFSGRSGKQKQELEFAEAARWILFLNSFDDCAAKNPSPKECWTSKLGLTVVKGKTLFETLMLNCQLLTTNQECWPENRPSWETSVSKEKLKEIARPKGPAALLSTHSRKISLDVSPFDTVTGYQVAAGDYFDGKNCFIESMTIWNHVEAKKNEAEYWIPQKYDPGRRVWQEFPTLIGMNEANGAPTIVNWINNLQDSDVGIIDKKHLITFEICSVYYGSMSCKIAKEIHDRITFEAAFLNKVNRKWQVLIQEMIQLTETVGREIGTLAYKIRMASNSVQSNNSEEERAKEQYYYQVDVSFREWLSNLSYDDELEDSRRGWRFVLKRIAIQCAEKMVLEAGNTAFSGRYFEVKNNKVHYSAPSAYNIFLLRIGRLLNERGS